MRRGAALLLLVGFSSPLMAAKSLSVEECEQLLAKLQGKSDARAAQEVGEVELTERVSLDRLAKWEKEIPGAKSHEALIRLADSAAFLKSPPSDLLRIEPPDSDTQERMLQLASDYVKGAMTRLPNLSATRQTTHFEDVPSKEQPNSGEWRLNPMAIVPVRAEARPLRSTGSISSTVTYREGKEMHDAPAQSSQESQAPSGLTTSGEFGPILAVVIGDAIRGQVAWEHWEQGSGDPVAVLRYAVPEDQSNFRVDIPIGTKFEEVRPAYHGEIAIDPATGSILRLSVVADVTGSDPPIQAAILVEYAPVPIGDRTCLCPVHGAAYSKAPVMESPQDSQHAVLMRTQLNDVEFTNYRLFGSQARIVVGGKGQTGPTAPAAEAGSPSSQADGNPSTPDAASAPQQPR